MLEEWIIEIHEQSRQTYGVRRVHRQLLKHGVRVSARRISRIKRKLGLETQVKKPFRATTDSNHKSPIAPNHLNREFTTEHPDDVYVGDITYIHTRDGWLYLAVWIDLYSRAVVGWSMAEHMQASLVCDALKMACFKRNPGSGLLIHSDRGSQYASTEFRDLLSERAFKQSMSRKGNCWDNAPAESFFHTLKTELVYRQDYQTPLEAKQSIFEYIEVFYNRQRMHSTIDYHTPEKYEKLYHKAA